MTTPQPNIRLIFTGTGPRVRGYPYLWIKSVEGFNHREHCAKCLKGDFIRTGGHYVPAINEWREIPMPPKARAIYVCGVSSHGYAHNLHAPLVHDPGADPIHIEMDHGQHLIVEHAKMLMIPALPDRWGGLPKTFTSCRNFQFAVSLFGYPSKGRSLLSGGDDAD